MRKGSIKSQRVNGEVQRVLAEAIRSLKDPRIHTLTTVSEVYVAPDLKTCKVHVSVLGSEEEKAETFAGLKSANGFLRSTLAKTLNMRRTPELIFVADDNTEYAIHMAKRIDEVMAEDDRSREARGETEDLTEEETEEG